VTDTYRPLRLSLCCNGDAVAALLTGRARLVRPFNSVTTSIIREKLQQFTSRGRKLWARLHNDALRFILCICPMVTENRVEAFRVKSCVG
jgi:hypothetical protein